MFGRVGAAVGVGVVELFDVEEAGVFAVGGGDDLAADYVEQSACAVDEPALAGAGVVEDDVHVPGVVDLGSVGGCSQELWLVLFAHDEAGSDGDVLPG